MLTRLGPVASGSRVPKEYNGTLNIAIEPLDKKCDCSKVKDDLFTLQRGVCEYELLDETIQSPRREELANRLVYPHIKLVNGQYKIPVPIISELLERLPNNYENVVKRTMTLKRSALWDSKRKQIFKNKFKELVEEKRIVVADISNSDIALFSIYRFSWPILPNRELYMRGAAMVNDVSLNQVVLAG